jgi:hypothetical protein
MCLKAPKTGGLGLWIQPSKTALRLPFPREAEFFCSLLEEHPETRYTSPLAAERIESIATKEKRKFFYPVQKTVL